MDPGFNYYTLNSNNKFITVCTNNAVLQIDTELLLLTINWKPYTDLAGFKAVFKMVVKLTRQYHVRRILHDASAQFFLSIEAHNWVIEEIVPQLKAAQVRKIARVVEQESMAFLISKQYHARINARFCGDDNFEFQIFTSPGEAFRWLNQ